MPAPLGVAAGGLALFMALLATILLRAQPLTLFGARRGRQHRLCGLVYLGWLAAGLADLWLDCLHRPAFDVSLPCVGLVLTLTAARDFGSESARGEQKVQQPASGPLDETAVVRRSEMLEHSFYQGLNIAQALYLHAHAATTGADQPPPSSWAGSVLLALATLPWCWRQRFPVNAFSANWSGTPKTWTAWLYRIKKWQYLLYKHCLLHGLNLSVALPGSLLGSGGGGAAGSVRVVHTRHWRLYWLSLNSAYVMEFFLQTCAPTQPIACPDRQELSPDLHA